jgi:hypothetical protein
MSLASYRTALRRFKDLGAGGIHSPESNRRPLSRVSIQYGSIHLCCQRGTSTQPKLQSSRTTSNLKILNIPVDSIRFRKLSMS